jgi:hypothetical protein
MKTKYIFSIPARKKAALFAFAAKHGVSVSSVVNRLIDGLLDGRITYDAPPPKNATATGSISDYPKGVEG